MTTTTHSHKAWTDKGGHVMLAKLSFSLAVHQGLQPWLMKLPYDATMQAVIRKGMSATNLEIVAAIARSTGITIWEAAEKKPASRGRMAQRH
jgi:hypothetical protein